MGAQGYIMQIQPFSVNDGDGIRTTIFMAGCPLRCRWCSNPEGFSAKPKVGWHMRKCIGCGACARVCPQGIDINMNAEEKTRSMIYEEKPRTMNDEEVPHAAASEAGETSDRSCQPRLERAKCIACGRCVEACPAGARTMMVRLMDADDILRQIQKHRLFYAYSGGGITFSGGEATSQPEFLDYLSREIYDMGYSMDIETSGLFDWDIIAPILTRMDLIFMDLKIFDSDRHLEYTGVRNEQILTNIANLAKLKDVAAREYEAGRIDQRAKGSEIVIRIPVVGGVNDDEANIRASAHYVHRHLPEAKMELLPYHSYGRIKYEALGLPYDHPEFSTPDKDRMEQLRDVIRKEGVEIADFR